MLTNHSYIHRKIEQKLLRIFKFFPIVVISGARQVGKSTLLTETFKNVPRVIFDPVFDVENARAEPELFLKNHEIPIILDEIQYAPELVPAIKRRLDIERRNGQYLITGSQQWNVMKVLTESLAGRVAFLDLDGFDISEASQYPCKTGWLNKWLNDQSSIASQNVETCKMKFEVYEQLWRGFLPEVQFLPKDLVSDYHSAYQRTYIERDVRMLANISDLNLFSRFFRLCSALTAQEINYSEIGREIGVTPQTATRWLDIFSATFQWTSIQAYSGNAIKRISLKQKGYIQDTGMTCCSQAISTPEILGHHPLWGSIFETAVINDIRKQSRLLENPPNFYHWRSHGGAEIDLLIEWNGKFYPIEIKGETNPRKNDSKGIFAFKKTYPNLKIAKGLIVSLSNSFYDLTNDVSVMPWNAVISDG